MKKTILTLALMLMMALAATAAPATKATSASKPSVEFKGDTITVSDGDKSVTLSGLPEMKKVRDKVNRALDDTLNAGSGTTVEIGDYRGDLSPDDVKEISNQWASVVKQMAISGSFCLRMQDDQHAYEDIIYTSRRAISPIFFQKNLAVSMAGLFWPRYFALACLTGLKARPQTGQNTGTWVFFCARSCGIAAKGLGTHTRVHIDKEKEKK